MGKLPMKGDILPPSDDHIFKTLLTHPDTKPALMDLLSALIEREVKDVQIRNNELPATDADEKAERLDLNCVVDDGDQANVEMQGSRIEEISDGHENFLNKSIYYLTDLHSSQKSKGIHYRDLVRTFQITFSTYTIFLGYADNPKHREKINEIIEKKEVLGMAGAVLAEISKDEHERAKFMARRKAETDRISNLLTAETRGVMEGMKKGIKKGKKEGIIEGVKKGTIEIALEMKADNIPVEAIAKYTKLSISEINKL